MFRRTELLNVVELGVQQSWSHLDNGKFPPRSYFRSVYKDRFKRILSIDITNEPGVTYCDLTKRIKMELPLFKGHLVLDFGTNEHVGTTPMDQYICWENTHRFGRGGAIFVHCLAETGSWKGHAHFYYDDKFFMNLIQKNNYSLLEYCRPRTKDQGFFTYCVYRKNDKSDKFMSFEDFDPFLKTK